MKITRDMELGYAQGNAIGAPVGAAVFAAAGYWLPTVIFAAVGVAGPLLWHRHGWRLSYTRPSLRDRRYARQYMRTLGRPSREHAQIIAAMRADPNWPQGVPYHRPHDEFDLYHPVAKCQPTKEQG